MTLAHAAFGMNGGFWNFAAVYCNAGFSAIIWLMVIKRV